ncbi:MAG: hypothetical protein AB7V32_10405 [Candidatus Berkiella sp.]
MAAYELEQNKLPVASLNMKLSVGYERVPMTSELREVYQEELIYSQKMFNNILRLKKVLLAVFNSQLWDCEHSGAKFTFTNKEDRSNQIKVTKGKDEVKLSGMPVSKLIEAVIRYENVVAVDVEYFVEALTLPDAVGFIEQLQKNNFDVSMLSGLDLKSKTPYELHKVLDKIKGDVGGKSMMGAKPAAKKRKPKNR